ncbi:MAG: sulfotransferase [Woeseiaceae bacterium]
MTGAKESGTIAELLDRGRRLLQQQKFAEAIAVANDMIRRFHTVPEGWALLSEINLRLGKLPEALENIQTAITRDGKRAELHAQLARCHTVMQHKHEAYDAATRAAALEPDDAATLDAVAAILSLCDEQEQALPLAEKAAQLEPGNPAYLYNLGAVQRMTGHIEQAEQNLDQVIRINPGDYRAYYTRSDLRRQTPKRNHVAEIETLLECKIPQWRGEMLLCFALAKECGDLADHDKSFAYLKRACDLQRKHSEYDVDDDIRTIDTIISMHTRDAFESGLQGCDSEEPFFIVGLPRTGTTLVERIIGSHSQVFAAGELQDFAAVLVRAVQGSGGRQQLTKEQMVRQSLQLDFAELGAAYIESTRPRTGHTPRFIDKLPLNYLYCGLIHAALPAAKIICLNRNPMDACFAMYRMMFNSAYPFAYDLEDLGRYYVAWHRLITHWQQELGDALLVVGYEKLVHNQEEVSRGIIRFCGLEWEDACLDFHKSDAASSTASAVQVRQPVYASSIGRWRLYEQQLQPLIDIFEENGIAIS